MLQLLSIFKQEKKSAFQIIWPIFKCDLRLMLMLMLPLTVLWFKVSGEKGTLARSSVSSAEMFAGERWDDFNIKGMYLLHLHQTGEGSSTSGAKRRS